MSLQDFLEKENETEKQKRFEVLVSKLIKDGMTKEEAMAQAQMICFKPLGLETPVIATEKQEQFYITFYFETKAEFDLVCKHFKVNGYNDYNTHYTKPLFDYIKAKMESEKK